MTRNQAIRGFMFERFALYFQKDGKKLLEFDLPQGSFPGPLLYLISFNDIQNVFKESELCIFADETCLVNQIKKFEDSYRRR